MDNFNEIIIGSQHEEEQEITTSDNKILPSMFDMHKKANIQPTLQDMFESPQKIQKIQSEEHTVQQTTISAIHDMDTSNNDTFALTACVLYAPTIVRWVTVPDRSSNGKSKLVYSQYY